MRKILIYSTLAIAVMAVACKKKEKPCQEPWNPECENYDPCYKPREDYKAMGKEFQVMKDSCLDYWLPKCMEIDGYKKEYDGYLIRDDSLQIPGQILRGELVGDVSWATPEQAAAILGAARTGDTAFTKKTAIGVFFNNNKGCLQ